MDEPVTPTLAEPMAGDATPVQPEIEKVNWVRRLWRRAHGVSPFASNVGLTIGSNVVIALSGLATGPICARLLGPTGRGQLAAIQNLYWFVGTVGLLGLADATLYFTAQKKEDSGRILASALVLVLLLSPLFFVVFFYLAPLLLAAQGADLVNTARWFLLGIPLYALCIIPQFTLRGFNDIARWNLLRLAPTLGWLVLLIGLGIHSKTTPRVVAFGYLAALAAALIPTFFVVRKRISDFRTEPKYWWPMLQYGIPVALASIPVALNFRLDQIVMAALLPARSLGIYVVGVSWSWAVPTALHAIGTVLFPRLANAEVADRGRLLAQGTRTSLFVAVLVVAAFAALAPVGIPLLFGKAFSESVAVGVVLVFAAGILGMNTVFEEGLRGIGATKTVLWGEMAGLLVTVVSLALLLRPLGIMGAGIASVLGYSATALVVLLGICKKIDHSPREVLLIKGEDVKLFKTRILALRAQL
ncbi:MAG TPA: oligosaccharide flippase family protein [Candidatus Angelobacter sp.]|nr:oligosaccharide flippase family protein [Candidatus Angelobacter sp.]